MTETIHESKNLALKVTEDGSHTLYSSRFHQHYHSLQGAVAESRHLFFEQNGLSKALQKRDQINILEIGFGTGLNFVLLMDDYTRLKSKAKVTYYSIEAYPAGREIIEKLNFGDYLSHPEVMKNLLPVFSRLKKGINEFRSTMK